MSESQIVMCNHSNEGITSSVSTEDAELIKKIKAITARGNDVEIRQKRDGKLAIYEIRKKAV